MRDEPLPPELAQVWGRNADIRYRGNGEWSSACPHCNPSGRGGRDPSDRFRMFIDDGPPRAWCRQCDRKFIANQESGQRISQEDREKARAKYTNWLQEENKRLRNKVKWLQEQEFWRQWHDNMGKDARELWHEAGIHDTLIDVHQLGYTIDRYQDFGGAMTVPYIHQDQIQTLQFRLMLPPDTGDKYRFIKGTKANWFYPWPHDEIGKVVLIVEGAKKAMVLWQTIAQFGRFTYRGEDITVIASPSKYVPNRMLDDLENTERVIWLLDPDAYDRPEKDSQNAIERNAIKVGIDKCKHIQTTGKIDDMILKYKLDGGWIQSAVEQSNPVILRDPKRRATTKYL